MPPSGFVGLETKMLSDFAESLLNRFLDEVDRGLHVSVEAGIAHELGIIETSLQEASVVEKGVLELVKQIYLKFSEAGDIGLVIKDLESLSQKVYK
jgi:hypothetical protein